MENGKIKYLVADTTAFINNVQLNEYAENILTVPDVVNEVKSRRQIRRLVVLPFDLKVQEPSDDSISYVTNYAKKTGDYASLSGIDLKVIALTYELETQHVGTEHLRSEPVVSRIIASKRKPEEFVDNTKLAGFFTPRHSKSENITENKEEHSEKIEILEKEDGNREESSIDDISEEELKNCFEKLNCEEAEDEVCDLLVPEDIGDSDHKEDDEDEEDNDDDDEWITPSNVKKVQKEFHGKTVIEVIPVVACMSTDYAVQNVLKQINLNLCALNGRVIKHIRTYILRCYACFKTTSVITKVFCPNCGNKTLKRVAVSLDENGQQVIHINTRRPLTRKYKNQSLPRPKGGKHSCNPIIIEDQPMPKQMPSRIAKTKTNALDEDYTAGYSPFALRDIDSKSALLRAKGNLKQLARNNAYEENRRKKNINRLVK